MTLYRNRYRVESTRLRYWDYAGAGWYFVTLCTRSARYDFGRVVNDIVELFTPGKIVAEEWLRTPQVRPYVRLDEWVVMPNHLHGILVIVADDGTAAKGQTDVGRAEAGGLQARSLGAIIGQVKAQCTRRIHAAGYTTFQWQARFYDRVIRDEASLASIRAYIRNNPLKWALDEYNCG